MNAYQKFCVELVKESDQFERARKCILNGDNEVIIRSLNGSSLNLFIAALIEETHHPFLAVSADSERARTICDDLTFFGLPDVYHYPKLEILPYEEEDPSMEVTAKHLDVYQALRQWHKHPRPLKPPVISAPLEALLQKIPSLEAFAPYCLDVCVGGSINTEELAEQLALGGYTRTPVVESRGEFSIRGGIIDVYPLNFEYPVRIDLFGTEIESIRFFDVYTQRSLNASRPVEEIHILPGSERLVRSAVLESGGSLVDFLALLPGNTLFCLDDEKRFPETGQRFQALMERQYQEARQVSQQAIQPSVLYLSYEALQERMGPYQRISHFPLPVQPAGETPYGSPDITFHASSFESMRPSLEAYLDMIARKQMEGFFVTIVCDNDGQVLRLDELLREHELGAVHILSDGRGLSQFQPRNFTNRPCDVVLSVGDLHSGFLFPEIGALFITDREMFGRYKRRHSYRKIYKGVPIRAADEIRRGDYVVHVEHGIGQFLGVRQQEIDQKVVDLIEILYQDDNKLLVPIEKIKYVHKYSGLEGPAPPLDRLGSKKWLQRKRKSQQLIEQMANDLLELYARRAIVGGHVFSLDTVWQREFEASFLYQETPDQLRAIEEVKEDMCLEKPMDRLVCGDVGYGKTEVAIRAAFKAVQDKKQVAVLVPTTVLAQQHYNTFRERFAEYPVRIAMLSRFKTPREQRQILKDLKYGDVDVVIGTHRLLSADVKFHDLGLLVVDEEQRFGVRHKERLKRLRTSVDVLTLTATPIPRTLHMALSGLRDMSLINTPPPDRHPIKTHIIHFDEQQIEEAVLRELNRNGQVFFVHNRIQTIDQVARRLQEVLPQARIAVAHGQMDERRLEQVMLDFVAGEYDILVSTTIIENGLDIPNVNTIIINRADAFGLAQLYQLRGRVGRDTKHAYAYLIVPHGQAITEAAVERLAAIEEFTELGVGFNVAMRDMEIRGTGNILGREQHGCIVSIGFDLYCQLLEKTVKRLKGEPVEEEQIAEITWNIDCYIPRSYIPTEEQRVTFYKKLAHATSLEDLEEIKEELIDRYGALPLPVENIMEISTLRILASLQHLQKLSATPEGIRLRTSCDPDELLSRLEGLRQQVPELGRVTHESDDVIVCRLRVRDDTSRLNAVVRLLNGLNASA
jgi:transcription-repair coupling factor (superfamily II helicase)